MIYFTSDTHFWHKAIIGYCNRPVPDVESMNKWLIDRWNAKVQPNDEVYFLGDFAFCGREKAETIFNQLNGIKHLITGNHDSKHVRNLNWEWVKDYYVLRVHDVIESDDSDKLQQYHQPIVLCHFPILSWDGMAHGSWHLHGHCHGSMDKTYNASGLRLDVGVDGNNWEPMEYSEIKNKLALRTVVPVDHHK